MTQTPAAATPRTDLEHRLACARAALLRGEAMLAATDLAAAAMAAPQVFEVQYALSAALQAIGQGQAADQTLDTARLLHALQLIAGMGVDLKRLQADPDFAVDIGLKLYGRKHVAMACVVFGMAVSAGYTGQLGLLSYGLALQHQGRAEEAIMVFRAVAELYPSAVTHQFLLYPHFLVDQGISRHALEACRWAALYGGPPPGLRPHGNDRNWRRPLRIGFVNPSSQLQSRQFLAPVFDTLDRSQFEVFLYPNAEEDPAAWSAPVTVRPIGQMNDATAAGLVCSDRIDVLIDCWGHTAGNRLTMFTHRPALVQVSFLNYQQTTGLDCMDYCIHADSVDAPGMAEAFTETIWRMGVTSCPFRPDGVAKATAAPVLRNGYVTFGSFIHPSRLTEPTVDGWAAILKGRLDSRLVLKYGYYDDPVFRAVTAARFLGRGVDPDRLEFRGHTTGQTYIDEFGDIDLALDPSPCPGGTTTLEAVSRGVPVLTLKGETFYSRLGVQVLAGAGMPDMVAESWDDYVATALEVSASPERLSALRDRVLPGFAAAPYRDEAGVTRRLGDAFRGMFRRWAEG
jgi:hypothetical protein